MTKDQPALFELPAPRIEPAPVRPEAVQLAAALPKDVSMGAMTWSYKGWQGSVYAKAHSDQELARYGLTAYVQHPLLRLAELDRTYYEPLTAEVFETYARQVPETFRFLVKAQEVCTIERYPLHARYGEKRGQDNPLFLDAEYTTRFVVEPALAGLGSRLLTLLFQFPPRDVTEPRVFAARLQAFLRRLPKTCQYAVELRNPELLTPEYGAALAETGAIHCYNAWTAMPSVLQQARMTPREARRPLLMRWLLRPGERFEEARQRYEPFDKLVAEDQTTRGQVATLVAKAHAHGVPAFVFVDNKAEGHAPASITLLGQEIVEQLRAFSP
ncbi:MAG: hypothetical protein RL701_1752 [Pseudomonadota bacterium]|jgi:uncharacterized protein YecE (DUF72 family)